nr:hypothetical protein [Allorhizobium ampelinum]
MKLKLPDEQTTPIHRVLPFSRVKSLVCLAHETDEITVLRIQADTDAGAETDGISIQIEWSFEGRCDALANSLGLAGIFKAGQQDDEFVAADPADKIGFPHSGAKTPGHYF